MTDPVDNSSTRPISVAELLAKNGSIGSPPVGGRRRRRRGNADSVTVAELTGEIPIITDATPEPKPAREPDAKPVPTTNGTPSYVESEPEVAVSEAVEEAVEEAPTEAPEAPEAPADEFLTEESVEEDEADEVAELDETFVEPEDAAAEADYEAHLEQRASEDAPVDFAPPPVRRPHFAPPSFSGPVGGAEQMSPDPVGDDDDDLGPHVDLDSLDFDTDDDDDADGGPSYLRSGSDTLFGGQSVADDLARRGAAPGPEDIDLGEDTRPDGDELVEERGGSAFLRGLGVVVQCILAVAFGAGLFIAFDLLWNWNTIVALVLAVLVILGLVAGVRVVRKTEDIGSTLIAVAVGALVAFGPLALLQTH